MKTLILLIIWVCTRIAWVLTRLIDRNDPVEPLLSDADVMTKVSLEDSLLGTTKALVKVLAEA